MRLAAPMIHRTKLSRVPYLQSVHQGSPAVESTKANFDDGRPECHLPNVFANSDCMKR